MMRGRGYDLYNTCFGNGAGYFGHRIGMILMIVFVVLVVFAIVLLVTRTNKRRTANDALETLKIRLANGEISEEEYLRRKNIIE